MTPEDAQAVLNYTQPKPKPARLTDAELAELRQSPYPSLRKVAAVCGELMERREEMAGVK